MTTNWFPYRWVCDNCGAVHYYNPEQCQRCKGKRLTQKVHNAKAAQVLEDRERQKRQREEAEKRRTDQDPQDLRKSPTAPMESPVSDAVPGMSGDTTVRQPEDPLDDPIDSLIDDILNG